MSEAAVQTRAVMGDIPDRLVYIYCVPLECHMTLIAFKSSNLARIPQNFRTFHRMSSMSRLQSVVICFGTNRK